VVFFPYLGLGLGIALNFSLRVQFRVTAHGQYFYVALFARGQHIPVAIADPGYSGPESNYQANGERTRVNVRVRGPI